ncbi:MAG: hypothetical protein AAGK14_11475 [Verrucomicrobiota bacterium]
MNADQQRFLYHTSVDPGLGFWVLSSDWEKREPSEISDDDIRQSKAGLVTYPSGEVLCQFGDFRKTPEGVHFMTGPSYSDDAPGFRRNLVRNGDGGVQVIHGPSRSQAGDARYNYSTKVTNMTQQRVRVTKFAPFSQGLFGIKEEPDIGYYSPLQFREWFRVENPQGWIDPGASAQDPDNYGSGGGVWAFFFETDQGDTFISTAPLEHHGSRTRRE